MNWIICNFCHVNIVNQLFHFTQCGHIYCKICIVKAQKQCMHCGERNVLSLKSTNGEDFEKVIHLFTKKFDLQAKGLSTENFQKMQLNVFIRQLHQVTEKYVKMKNYCWIHAGNYDKQVQEFNSLKKVTKELHKEVEIIKNEMKRLDEIRMQSNRTAPRNPNYLPYFTTNSSGIFETPNSFKTPKSILKPPSAFFNRVSKSDNLVQLDEPKQLYSKYWSRGAGISSMTRY